MAKKTTLLAEAKRAPKVKFVLIEYSLTGQRTYVPVDVVPKLLMAGCKLVRDPKRAVASLAGGKHSR